jgi:hypothetical protein
MEAYMKAIDKSRFKTYLPKEDQDVAVAGGMSEHEASQQKKPAVAAAPPPVRK